MPTYKIACTWQVYGELDIDAPTLDKAIEIAEDGDTSLPVESDYVDSSFEVDIQMTEELNNLHILEIWQEEERMRKEKENERTESISTND
jgi:xylose isomerase